MIVIIITVTVFTLQIRVDEKTVGRNISTKSVYNNKREDVTLHYKYPEGGAEIVQ